jgi:hypothetical protein
VTKRIVLALALSFGCAGAASEEPEAFGWCCEGLCGLAPEDAAAFDSCTCDGLVRPLPGTPGACFDPAEPWR